MRQAVRLLKGSALQIFRDQMLLLLCIAPFLVGAALRILVPLVDQLLIKYLSFSISPYYLISDTLSLIMGAVLIGMMVGLLMLDERDDGICTYYAVTPAGGFAYLISRLVLPFCYSLAANLAVISFAALGGLEYTWMFAPAILSSCSGVMMSMLLVSIASNKVEGLAVSKLTGIILSGIPITWFANSYLRLIGFLLPTYWITDMLIQAEAGRITNYIIDLILGMLCVSTWIAGLYRIFIRKIS
ncbi:MAG: hypothetical protein ABFD25_10790 [Clostridiaceae bacterium]